MNRFKAEAERYRVIEFYIKCETICNNCLNIKFNEFNWHSMGAFPNENKLSPGPGFLQNTYLEKKNLCKIL